MGRRQLAGWVITTGGTGLTERDVTPEATQDVAGVMCRGVMALWLEGLKKDPVRFFRGESRCNAGRR
jgi:molybdopterin biosynthesis enzyme MoaB